MSEYLKGKKNGIRLVYDESGTLKARETYVDDALTATAPPDRDPPASAT